MESIQIDQYDIKWDEKLKKIYVDDIWESDTLNVDLLSKSLDGDLWASLSAGKIIGFGSDSDTYIEIKELDDKLLLIISNDRGMGYAEATITLYEIDEDKNEDIQYTFSVLIKRIEKLEKEVYQLKLNLT
jgi:hypothetical protein